MTLLNTALDYTRLQEGVIQYEVVDFDAAAVAREVMATLRPLAMARHLALKLEVPEALSVRGDPVRLRQVMNNLLSNAIKFTEAGFVKLSLKHEGSQLVGKVVDTGPGIVKEDRERIFTPFFTRVVGPDATAPGAGLGLSVSREMIVQQGGSLTLDCPDAGGAEFTFCLPYPGAADRARQSGQGKVASMKFTKELRVLYAEDTPSNQEVMRLTLAGAGVRLTCAGTAREALECFSAGSFDLVMVDLQLPDLSGADLAREILKLSPECPVIAVTAQSSAKSDAQLREAGIVEVILKPYRKEQVLGALARHVSGKLREALRVIHPGDGAKAGRLAGLMAREFCEAAGELRQFIGATERGGEVAESCASIRHRLTTALARFPFERVEVAFDNLEDGEGSMDTPRIQELIEALEEAGAQLEEQGGAGELT